MPYNLLEERWIPVRTPDGSRRMIAPWEIAATAEGVPIVAVDTPRADFNGALIQFLIGLVQTSRLIPKREPDWMRNYRSPPEGTKLREAFAGHKEAFFLNGDGPRFLQDLTLEDGAEWPIGDLLIDQSGNEHFIKPRAGDGFCFGCTATALYCLHTNAPEGGRGHFTGLRGGGPLTTLVLPREDNLWETVWLNVISEDDLSSLSARDSNTAKQDIFPWLAPTRTGEKKTGKPTFPEDAHPLQMYWSMPRRIRIDFSDLGNGLCDICGNRSENLVRRFFARPYGVNYEGPWKHPLTPYLIDQKGTLSSRKARPESINYRNWIGLVLKSTNGVDTAKVQGLPALVVERFTGSRRQELRKRARLWGFGYDMEHKRARCWFEGRMPIHAVSDRIARAYEVQTERMVKAAIGVGNMLVWCLKQAWFADLSSIRGDFGFLDTAFWSGSEPEFFKHLEDLIGELEKCVSEPPLVTLRSWHTYLCKVALKLFDEYATSGPIEDEDPARIARARNMLKYWSRSKKVRVDILQLPDQKQTSSARSTS